MRAKNMRMRDHATIVRSVGAAALARLLGEQEALQVSASTPQRWADRNSIPGEYWATLSRLGIASLEELAAAADRSAEAA